MKNFFQFLICCTIIFYSNIGISDSNNSLMKLEKYLIEYDNTSDDNESELPEFLLELMKKSMNQEDSSIYKDV